MHAIIDSVGIRVAGVWSQANENARIGWVAPRRPTGFIADDATLMGCIVDGGVVLGVVASGGIS